MQRAACLVFMGYIRMTLASKTYMSQGNNPLASSSCGVPIELSGPTLAPLPGQCLPDLGDAPIPSPAHRPIERHRGGRWGAGSLEGKPGMVV